MPVGFDMLVERMLPNGYKPHFVTQVLFECSECDVQMPEMRWIKRATKYTNFHETDNTTSLTFSSLGSLAQIQRQACYNTLMPELPEVETITKRLAPYLESKEIERVEILHPKAFAGDPDMVTEKAVRSVSRRAKMIRIQLDHGLNLLIHLKMTGQLIYVDDQHRVGGGHPTHDWITQLPSTHTRLIIHWTDGSKLFFNDQRMFGWIRLMRDQAMRTEFAKYAVDVTDPDFTLEYFQQFFVKKTLAIKLLILDQAIVAGIGNIYACDALNLAQLSPFRSAKTLSSDEIERLYNAVRAIIQKGIDLGGATTDGKYIDVHGFAGKYQLEARVYDRKGQACLNCGNEIVKATLGGRGTYWCKNCQI